jgi:hypothetical protein
MATRSLSASLRRGTFAALLVLAAPAMVATSACGSHGPDVFARMSAAKKQAEFDGFKNPGPSLNDTVEEGKDTRLKLELKETCYRVYAFPGDGVKALDLSLLDPSGKAVGQTMQADGSTQLKYCPTEAGSHTLVVRSQGGSGPFMVQSWANEEKAEVSGPGTCTGPDCPDEPGPNPGGVEPDDCSAGLDLAIGATVKGNVNRRGMNGGSMRWTCASGEGNFVVYRLHVEGRHKLVLDLNAKYDAVLALYRSTSEGYLCEQGNEMECSDDAEGSTNKSHIEALVDTGDYGVVVSSFDGDRGDFELRAQQQEAPGLETYCNAAKPITPDAKMSDVVGGNGSNFRASCGNGDGDELLYKLDLKNRSRVRATAKTTAGGDPTISIRTRCEDPMSELQCSNQYRFEGVSWTGLMSPGSYTVIVDASDPQYVGTAEVQVDVAPDGGQGGVEGDTCKDAKPLPTSGSLVTDTFKAKGDARVSCASDPSADVVYKLDVKSKSRVFVYSSDVEGRHVLAIQKTCSDLKSELSCDLLTSGKQIDQTLEPGSYSFIVKGKGVEDFGRTRLNMKVRDLGAAAGLCKAAPKIESGKSISDTTAGAADNFVSPGCGGSIAYQASGDKVYQFTLKERSHVNVQLKPGSFYNTVLSLRSDCADPTRGEIVCASYYQKTIDRDLDPGTYYVVVDGYGTKAEGAYTIELTTKKL